MKKYRLLPFFIAACFLFYPAAISASASNQDYIVKYKNDDAIYIISETEKNELINVTTRKNAVRCATAIEYIEPDYEVFLFGDSADTNWNYNAVNANYSIESGCFGNDIKIGIIDSGLYAHAYFYNNILAGYNFINDNTDTSDNIGHGTFVSSIIGNGVNASYATGIANKAKLIPLKCFADGQKTTTSLIARAIQSAVDDFGCQVINMSFGMSSTSTTLNNSVNYALSKGVILVASAGNYGTTILNYPASYDGVVGVGSINSKLEHSLFSQHNASVDVVAPGEEIMAKSIDTYAENSGTSFSAPHVTAAAAIALCIDSALSPTDFQRNLSETSVDLGENGYDEYFGYGLLDIRALSEALIKRYDYFMSPVNSGESRAVLTIFNNTENELNAVMINAGYESNHMTNLDSTPLFLPANDKNIVEIENRYSNSKYFLWNRLSELNPLCKYRRSP